jgi:hypothetical protein
LKKLYGGTVPDIPSIGTVPWEDLTKEQREDMRKVMRGEIDPII